MFGDRLINADDNNWLTNVIDESLSKAIGLKINDLIPNQQISDLIYGDFCSSTKISYQPISDMKQLKGKLQLTLNQCNDEIGGMNLVLFNMAVMHLSRIVRSLRQANSNMLLIGVGGVGR